MKDIEKAINRLAQERGDNCTLCNRAFKHNEKTSAGTTKKNQVQIVGDCCASQLKTIYATGVYVTRHSAVVGDVLASKDVEAAQAAVSAADDTAAQIMRRAGLSGQAGNLISAVDVWNIDDREWFSARANRTHRIRAAFDGESATWPDLPPPPAPLSLCVVVVQVQPGQRVRSPIYLANLERVDDTDEVIAALVDHINKQPGKPFTADDIRKAAQGLIAPTRKH